jgi:hypothetical protein
MRTFFVVSVLVGVVSAVRGDEKQLEKILAESVTASEKLVDVLKTIKDEPTAKSALPKLAELGSLLRQCQQASKVARDDVSEEALKSIADRFAKRSKEIDKQLQVEIKRVEAIPQAYKVVQDTDYFKMIDEGRRERAKVDLNVLVTASTSFKLKYGDYPEKLEQLAKPPDGFPFVENKSLVDPWGRPYQYDPKGEKNDGLQPDIWSLGPRSKDGAIIGNWMKKSP